MSRILISENVRQALGKFLNYKAENGSIAEQKIYVNMTINDFINRLVQKRPLFFDYKTGKTMLRNGVFGNMMEEWIKVGSKEEQMPLVLNDYLSFEEMELASLISIASPAFLINNNLGGKDDSTSCTEAIIIDVTTARLDHPYLMDGKYVLRALGDAEMNELRKSPLLMEFAEIFNEIDEFPTDVSLKKDLDDPRYRKFYTKIELDCLERYVQTDCIRKRMNHTLLQAFRYANDVSIERGRGLVVRIVGNVQDIIPIQDEIISFLGVSLPDNYIGNVEMMQFYNFECPKKFSKEEYAKSFKKFVNDAGVEFMEGSVSDPLPPGKEECILVIINAADTNSFPGNVYWLGSDHFSQSMNAVITSTSTIQELHNPLINHYLKAPEHLNVYPISLPRNSPFKKKRPSKSMVEFNDMITKSYFFDKYDRPFPLRQNRIHEIYKRVPASRRRMFKESIARHIKGVRIIADSRVIKIIEHYLKLKKINEHASK